MCGIDLQLLSVPGAAVLLLNSQPPFDLMVDLQVTAARHAKHVQQQQVHEIDEVER